MTAGARARGLPARIVVAGPSGSGKTTVGLALAAATGRPFLDADDLHPARNRALMAAGTPLTDEDRWPWLDAVRAAAGAFETCVVACSALRRVYRDRLAHADAGPGVRAGGGPDLDVGFVLLTVPAAELERRVAHRPGHFMPASLVTSQVATLEPPAPGERVLVLDATQPVAAVVERVLASGGSAWAGASSASPGT